MSHVSVDEVIAITADAFGVTLEEMARHYRGRRSVRLPAPLAARGAAVLLARRHTPATLRDIVRLFGWNQTASPDRFRRLALKVEGFAKLNAEIRRGIERAEAAIDELHEGRLDMIDQMLAAGPDCCGWTDTRSATQVEEVARLAVQSRRERCTVLRARVRSAVASWRAHALVDAPGASIAVRDACALFHAYCTDRGLGTFSRHAFSLAMSDAGVSRIHVRTDCLTTHYAELALAPAERPSAENGQESQAREALPSAAILLPTRGPTPHHAPAVLQAPSRDGGQAQRAA